MAGERKQRRRMDPDERRAQLLACAIKAFAARGIDRATHADVAREAGVSVPTVFVYFPTRAELADAVLVETDRFFTGMVGDALASATDPHKALMTVATTFADMADSHPDHVRVWLDWSTAVRDELWPRYLEFQERVIGLMRKSIRTGQRKGLVPAAVAADDAARMIVGDAHMVALMKLSGRPKRQVDRFLGHLVESALGAVGGEG